MENNTYMDPDYKPQSTTDMTVGAWVGTLLLMMIPLVNVICLIVWAVSSSPEKRSRKNWAIAQFIIWLIMIVLTIVLAVLIGAGLANLLTYL